MEIQEIKSIIQGEFVAGPYQKPIQIEYAMASDLMSDVLTLETENATLITGLANMQTIRTVEMQEIKSIILARGKRATPEMVKLARENEITIVESPFAMYRISGILFQQGIQPHY